MSSFTLKASGILDTSHSIAGSYFEELTYVWEILPKIKDIILELIPKLPGNFREVSPGIWVGEDTDIAATASIAAPAIIGCNTEIRPSAYLRGNTIVGDNAVVGNSSELKNSILFDNVQVPHYNYIGDSILGYKAHFGAGSITSNVKSIKSNVTIRLNDGEILDTGLRKFGAVVGDFSEVGCNAVLNPGSVVGRNCVIYPLVPFRGIVAENHIVKSNGMAYPKR